LLSLRLKRSVGALVGATFAVVLAALMLALFPAVAEAQTKDKNTSSVVVRPGDCLWSISEERLAPNASPQRILNGTEQIYTLNRELIGADPDLIFVGQELLLPPAMSSGRPTGATPAHGTAGKTTGAAARGGRVSSPDHVVRISDVDFALDRLAKGRKVELDQPRQVSTLLDKLAEKVKEAEARGEKAPNIDLCNVSVKGTNLFCAQSKNVARIDMPQLKGVPAKGTIADMLEKDSKGKVDLALPFVNHLRSKGVGVEETHERVAYLKATQGELVGAKVAGIAARMRRGEFDKESPIFISSDNYIVYSHHRWAAKVGVDYEDGMADMTMPVRRIDMPILEVLEEARTFVDRQGIPRRKFVARHSTHFEDKPVLRDLASDHWRSQPRDREGQWSRFEVGDAVMHEGKGYEVEAKAKVVTASYDGYAWTRGGAKTPPPAPTKDLTEGAMKPWISQR
jgi:hypothetical protein